MDRKQRRIATVVATIWVVLLGSQLFLVARTASALPHVQNRPLGWTSLYEQARDNSHTEVSTIYAPFLLIRRELRGAHVRVPLNAPHRWMWKAFGRLVVQPSKEIQNLSPEITACVAAQADHRAQFDNRILYIVEDGTDYVLTETAGGPYWLLPQTFYRALLDGACQTLKG